MCPAFRAAAVYIWRINLITGAKGGYFRRVSHLPVITDSHPRGGLSLDMALLKKFIMITRESLRHLANGISELFHFSFLFFFLAQVAEKVRKTAAEVVETWTVKKKRGSVTFK